MTTSGKKNNPALADTGQKKQLTPRQMQARKKMIIFPLLFLLFAGSMWLIFAPFGDMEQQQGDGFNTELPTPKESDIFSDKREAYVQQEMQAKQEQKVRSLQDFAFALGDDQMDPEREARQLAFAPKPSEYYDDPSRFDSGSTPVSGFQSSTSALQQVNRNLGSFYEEISAPTDDPAQSEMMKRIAELESRLEQEAQRRTDEDEQLALIEKSYEIAARYMGGPQAEPEPQPTTNNSGKSEVQPVTQVRHNVVSLLSAPMSNDEFLEEFVKARNWGFNTAAGDEGLQDKNSISACIYQTVTIIDGQQVQLRLQEPMRAGNLYIPENTILTGSARLNGERMGITIEAVQYAGNVIPVELLVYDLDGVQGISVPGSEEINAIKEIAANMGSGMGSSITITDDAGSQLLADLGRSAIQGTSQYISKKMRTVKVTLKAGYKMLIIPKDTIK